MKNTTRHLWTALLLPAVIVFLSDPTFTSPFTMANRLAMGTLWYLITSGLSEFAVWVIRYRAIVRLQRRGLLYLALLREQIR